MGERIAYFALHPADRGTADPQRCASEDAPDFFPNMRLGDACLTEAIKSRLLELARFGGGIVWEGPISQSSDGEVLLSALVPIMCRAERRETPVLISDSASADNCGPPVGVADRFFAHVCLASAHLEAVTPVELFASGSMVLARAGIPASCLWSR